MVALEARVAFNRYNIKLIFIKNEFVTVPNRIRSNNVNQIIPTPMAFTFTHACSHSHIIILYSTTPTLYEYLISVYLINYYSKIRIPLNSTSTAVGDRVLVHMYKKPLLCRGMENHHNVRPSDTQGNFS